MSFGSNTLKRDSEGSDVVELQLRLAGFGGNVWDGDFGPGTERQVMAFQSDFMKETNPSGEVDEKTFRALDDFAHKFLVDFKTMKCTCGQCHGFGKGRFKGEYRKGEPEIEAYHKREYPGIHRAIIESFRAAQFYAQKGGFDLPFITSGYRCWIDNEINGRQSTNHMGKALDYDFHRKPGEEDKDDRKRCDNVRDILVEKCNFQIGWSANNKKALEPSNIAPTWIHMDVRCYSQEYLDDKYFVQNINE